jgi:hypothetical protein
MTDHMPWRAPAGVIDDDHPDRRLGLLRRSRPGIRRPATRSQPSRSEDAMPTSDKSTAPAERADDTARSQPTAPPAPPRTIASVAPGPRRTIASYANYADAESAVDRLGDQGFPVERGAIVGT